MTVSEKWWHCCDALSVRQLVNSEVTVRLAVGKDCPLCGKWQEKQP
jgi:hypothetical protein